MLQAEYWISELADLSGVSTRTIRYYVAEGLLPQPEIRGKYAIFTDDYLHRLNLIKQLKDAYLPLRDIKTYLDGLSIQEIIQLSRSFERDPVGTLADLQPTLAQTRAESQSREEPGQALDYIASIRSKREVFSSPPKEVRQPPRVYSMPSSLPKTSPLQEDEWQRIYLLPGLELHVLSKDRFGLKWLIDKLVDIVNKEIK